MLHGILMVCDITELHHVSSTETNIFNTTYGSRDYTRLIMLHTLKHIFYIIDTDRELNGIKVWKDAVVEDKFDTNSEQPVED